MTLAYPDEKSIPPLTGNFEIFTPLSKVALGESTLPINLTLFILKASWK